MPEGARKVLGACISRSSSRWQLAVDARAVAGDRGGHEGIARGCGDQHPVNPVRLVARSSERACNTSAEYKQKRQKNVSK